MNTSVTLLMLFETYVLNILYFYFVELRGSVDSAYFVEGSSSHSRSSIIYFSVHLWNTQCKEWAIGMYSLSAHIHITGISETLLYELFFYIKLYISKKFKLQLRQNFRLYANVKLIMKVKVEIDLYTQS